jgi:hypothetical protein
MIPQEFIYGQRFTAIKRTNADGVKAYLLGMEQVPFSVDSNGQVAYTEFIGATSDDTFELLYDAEIKLPTMTVWQYKNAPLKQTNGNIYVEISFSEIVEEEE